MTPLDLTVLYDSYAGRGKTPHRLDVMLTIVLFALRRGSGSPARVARHTREWCPVVVGLWRATLTQLLV
jgi:hypothetical protein